VELEPFLGQDEGWIVRLNRTVLSPCDGAG
jgi:hypothetical protein